MPNQFPSRGRIKVESPCNADWDAMIGNHKMRFCEHCNLHVNNLDELSDKQLRRLVSRSNGRLCVRYVDVVPHSSLVLPPLHQILGRRASRIAAGAFSAALSLSTAAVQQANANQAARSAAVILKRSEQPAFLDLSSSIAGVISDTKGVPIDGATITLTNGEKNIVLSVSTDSQGKFKFNFLEVGTYDLVIQAPGFTATEEKGIYVSANNEQRIDRSLSNRLPLENGEDAQTVKTETVIMGVVASIRKPLEPLVLAAQEDDIDKVRELLLKGAKINVRDKPTDLTALDFAAQNANLELLRFLITEGADTNSANKAGRTPLMQIGQQSTRDIVTELLNGGAKVDTKDSDGDTALGEAAEYNDSDVLKALLEAGAKINFQNNEGATALMRAAGANMVNNVRMLLRAGADFNLRDREGKTALSYATSSNNAVIVRMLKAYGASEGEAKPEQKEQ